MLNSMIKKSVTRLAIFHDAQPYGLCQDCHRKFVGSEADIRKQFAEHECKEDFSQAAARIVREATKNK